jgi:IS5 family transposase
MGPKPQTPQSGDLFRVPLAEHLNPKHELVLLDDAMDWSEIERTFSAHFTSKRSRPALAPWLVAGQLYLQHAYNCSDVTPSTLGSRTRSGCAGETGKQ